MNPLRLLTLAACALITFISIVARAGPGEWDQSYAPAVIGGPVYALVIQPDGRLIVGGAFSSVAGSKARTSLARLNSDGTLDPNFFLSSPTGGFSGAVWSLALQSNGSIVMGGDFTYISGSYRFHVARLNANGTLDGSFVPTNAINNSVLAVAVQTNNAVVIGGTFGGYTVQGFPGYVARLNPDGTTDATFIPIVNQPVYAIAIQPDGKILIGGAFTLVNGANRYHIARLNSDGSLDNTFQNGLNGASSNVRSIQIQSDGKILIGGDFTSVNNTIHNFVARLTSTGSLDNGFGTTPGLNGSVYSMAIQTDGNILVGGAFSAYVNATLSHVARLYDDGTRETTFTNFGINNTVESLAIQTDGGIIIGGLFSTVNNTNAPFLARLYGNLYPPEFTAQPASVNTNIGANVTFSAQVSNPTTTSFQWLKNGADIPGATETTYRLFNVQPADSANYSVFVTDAIGGVNSSNALLQVGIAPAITSQPTSVTVTPGQSASFSVTATGTPLNYFWLDNGVFIPGQTNSSLSIASVEPANAGIYACVVSNFLGNVTSTGAVLTVDYPPIITAQPIGQNVAFGSNFTLSVTANGYPALGYQWRTNGGFIPGATAVNYSVVAAQISDSGAYDVIVTNAFGSITSSVAVVEVGFPPSVIQQPLSLTNAVGGTANFSCLVTGSVPINLQWTLDGNLLAGATNSNLTITNLQPGNIGNYALTATNMFGGTASSNAALNLAGYSFSVWDGLVAFYPFNGNSIDATGNGNNGTVVGATLTADRFGEASNAYSFDGISSEIDVPDTSGFDQNQHSISVWLNAATLSPQGRVRSDVIEKGATQQWAMQLELSGNIGNEVTTSSGLFDFDSSNAVVTGAWFQVVLVWDGAIDSTYINGVYDSSLATIGSLVQGTDPMRMGGDQSSGQFFEGGLDDVRIYDRALSSNDVANLFLLEADVPVISQQPQAQLVTLGGTANFSVTATAVHPLFYQWQINGAAIPGATNALLTLPDIQPANLGSYSVTVSNGFTGVLSSAVTLGIEPSLAVTSASSQSLNLNVLGIPGTSYVLQTATNLTPPINWQPVLTNQTDTNGLWQFSDANLDTPQKFYRVATP
jgi:uncharacterized delta-60 repeat protein